jgi:cell division septum initiation protein DivIVA
MPDLKREYQTEQELLEENRSLEKQIDKLRETINKKTAFYRANAEKIDAWAVILDK